MTDTTPTAFCQNCGTALTPATTRTVGPATYCEPCLDARLHGANNGAPRPPVAPYPGGPSIPNPGLAALLGLIPGVGAMYNEQYAKGIVHLIVFAVLIALTDASGLFGIFIFGWVCYMVIEAHHTARARRDHTPLPNPFGLNDIGERLGFGKSWPGGAPNVASVFHDAAAAAAHAAQQFQSQHHNPFHPGPNPAANPFYTPPTQTPPAAPAQDPAQPSSFGDWQHTTHQYTQNAAAGTQQPWRETFTPDTFTPGPLPSQPFSPPVAPIPPITGASRFPAGAVLLIAAGIFFLLATTGLFSFFRRDMVIGFGLIALAVWIFLRRSLASRASSSPRTPRSVLCAARGAVWVGLTGVLFLLDSSGILRWHHSWPLYIILAGVMGFLERAAQHHAALHGPTQ